MNKTKIVFFLILTIFSLPTFSFNIEKDEVNLNENAKLIYDLPNSKDPLVVRTYFDSEEDWIKIKEKIGANYELGFKAYVEFLNDKNYENATIKDLIQQSKPNYKHLFIFVADSLTFSTPENTILCIDLYDEVGKSFRVIPSEMWSVENNLSIANMFFIEFYENCDSDGVFRGFNEQLSRFSFTDIYGNEIVIDNIEQLPEIMDVHFLKDNLNGTHFNYKLEENSKSQFEYTIIEFNKINKMEYQLRVFQKPKSNNIKDIINYKGYSHYKMKVKKINKRLILQSVAFMYSEI